jgi:hypothetical protein
MITILKYRVALITLLFGAFGGALSLLLKVEDLKTYYPALAALIALTVSLLISFLIKAKWNTHFRNQLKAVSVVLFLLFLGTAGLHTYYIIDRTFEYKEFDEVNRYVKGSYSPMAYEYRKKYPNLSDEEILYQNLGGSTAIDVYWTKDSINKNIFSLIITYCCVVLFFVACISLLLEVSASRYKKQKKKAVAQPV